MSDELKGYDAWRTAAPQGGREITEAEDNLGMKLIYDEEFAEVTGYYEEGLGSSDPDDYELMYELTIYGPEYFAKAYVPGHGPPRRRSVEITSGELEELLVKHYEAWGNMTRIVVALNDNEQAILGDALNLSRSHLADYPSNITDWMAVQRSVEVKLRRGGLSALVHLDGERQSPTAEPTPEEPLAVGDLVTIIHPTGGCLQGTVYRVIPAPEGKDSRWTWILYARGPLPSMDQHRYTKPMGFHFSALKKESS